MEAFCIEGGTHALKGQRVLWEYGIRAEMKRSGCAGNGCAYELTVSDRDKPSAEKLLRQSNIEIKSKRRLL